MTTAASSSRTSSIRAAALVAAAAALLAVIVAACGDDPAPVTEAEPPPERRPEPGGARLLEPGDGRGGVKLREIGRFDAPVYLAQPPDEDRDLYVVEQGGRVVRLSGTRKDPRRKTFLDVRSQTEAEGERGLLSIAFDPDFRNSGLFYVDFTNLDGDTRVVEYEARDGVADPDSARTLLAVEQPFPNHNGGQLQFGPDGFLYVGMGDGGSGGDPDRNASDPTTLLGALLRIDPERGRKDANAISVPGSEYSVPADNPFADGAHGRPEIYAIGLRNPWRFSFDRKRGWLSIGDVGQNAVEEVNLVGAGKGRGANFGWSAFEGDLPFNGDVVAPDAVEPVLAYDQSEGGCSVTGGYVSRDASVRSTYGRYVYGDFCRGELRSFTAKPRRSADDDRPLGLTVPRLSSFGEDSAGRLYAMSLESGAVHRLVAKR